VVHLT